MATADFIAKYDGKKIGDGECGTAVRAYAIEVQGVTPVSYPSAKDYWFSPVPGYYKVSTPQEGDWAIYNAHGAYPDGHMAIYIDGRVFEQNADPDGSPAHLFNRANTYLLGYLREGEDMIPDDDNNFARWSETFQMIRGRTPTRAEFQASAVGKSWLAALEILEDSQEAIDCQHAQTIGFQAISEKWGPTQFKALGQEVYVKS